MEIPKVSTEPYVFEVRFICIRCEEKEISKKKHASGIRVCPLNCEPSGRSTDLPAKEKKPKRIWVLKNG